MSERTERLARIREILLTEKIASQEDLADRLDREGFAATQSGISRDLRELGAAKAAGAYRIPGGRAQADLNGIGSILRRVTTAGPNLVVVHTAVGSASRAALEIDRGSWPEVCGTIGGDDTVFVAVTDAQGQEKILRRLRRALRKEE